MENETKFRLVKRENLSEYVIEGLFSTFGGGSEVFISADLVPDLLRAVADACTPDLVKSVLESRLKTVTKPL